MASGIVESSQSGSDQQPQQNQPISRTRLVQRLLASSANLPNFIHDLVYTQATLVAGTEAVAFLIEPAQDQDGNKGFNLKPAAHIRPDESDADTRAAALTAFQEIMKPCIQQGKDGAIHIEGSTDGSDSQFCLVTLLRSEGNVVAASAVITRARDLERAQKLLTPMQLVAGYFDLFALRRGAEQSRSIAQSHQHVLQLATAVATGEGFVSAAMNLCNELASRTSAARVSLGWLKGEHIKLTALSHTEEFDKKQELSVQIVKVMEECVDNDEIVQYEPDGTTTNTVTREAQILSRAQGGEAILSLPLRRKGEIVGIVTLEFTPNQKIGAQAATGLAVAVDLLAPQLYDRYQNDRWLITKVALSVHELGKKAIGPKFMLAKTIIFVVISTLVFLVVYQPMYHVTASFQFTPVVKRSISSPMEAKLKDVYVKPGDKVKKDQLLAEFDVTELKLQMESRRAEAERARQEAESYKTNGEKTAEREMALWAERKATYEADALDERINRAKIVADFDGEILTGDLRDKVHALFKQGDPLMELAQTSDLEAELHVAERDIQDVHEGSTGFLATNFEPSDKFPFTIRRIVPVGVAKEGGNLFTVYATIAPDKVSEQWKAGGEGEAKVDVGRRRLGWIWVHRFVDWLHFKWWTMW